MRASRAAVVAAGMLIGAVVAAADAPTRGPEGDRPAPSSASASLGPTPPPTELGALPPSHPEEVAAWMPEARRCSRRSTGGRFCDGPRRIPAPHGEAAELAERLGLGTQRFVDHFLGHRAPEEVLRAVPGEARRDLLWPVPEGFMGRGFGYVRRARLRHRLHKGVDIPAARGSFVRAANDGLVVYADNGVRGYGNLVVVLHPDDTRTHYAHLRAAVVFAGQAVRRGQPLGQVGRTGMTRAPHLHFEWRRGAIARNPRRRFVGRPSFEEERQLQLAAQRRREASTRRLLEARARAERRRADRDG